MSSSFTNNNPQNPDLKQNQLTPSSVPLLSVTSASTNQTLRPNITQSQQSKSSQSILDVYSTPVQPNKLSKLSPTHDISPSHIKLVQSMTTPSGLPLLNATPQFNDSRIKLEPGFVSLGKDPLSNHLPIHPSTTPQINSYQLSQQQSSNYSLNPYTQTPNIPHLNQSNVPNLNEQSRNFYNNSRGKNFHLHSRFPSDITDTNNENLDQSGLMLNTPDRSSLHLPNPIQLPYNHAYNKYSPYEHVPTGINRKGHSHSLSLDTVGSNFSIAHRSLNEDWRRHRHTLSNTSVGTNMSTFTNASANSSAYEDNVGFLETAREFSSLPNDQLLDRVKAFEPFSSNLKYSKENKNVHVKKKRQQQLFALITLCKNVKISSKAVCPRNVVYSKYVDMCKQFSTSPLCNAAFGKMVKIFYPAIKTRRLGIRGSSVYNYCGIELLDKSYTNTGDSTPDEGRNMTMGNPMQSLPENSPQNSFDSINSKPAKLLDKNQITVTDESVNGKLKFNNQIIYFLSENVELLPNLNKIVTNDVKPIYRDIIIKYFEFLTELYTSWRYLKIESLLNKLSDFHFNKLLTETEYRVFINDFNKISSLILLCDFEYYKNSIKLILKIIFQQVPEKVSNALLNFESGFKVNLAKMKEDPLVLKAQIKIASDFIKIITVLRKVIYLSDTTSRLLADKKNRDVIAEEWKKLKFDNLISHNSLIPNSQKDAIIKFLQNNVTNVLISLDVNEEGEHLSSESGAFQNNVIKVLSSTFSSIPNEFDNVEAKELLLFVDYVTSSIIREFTWESGTSNFTIWWTLASWCNEYLTLMAEVGRFL